jgi:phthalate 4,5-cis-dihydrodiol dehydrogenase
MKADAGILMETSRAGGRTVKNTAASFQLRVGIAGLGVAASQVLPAFRRDGSPYALAGGADIRADVREAFGRQCGCPTYASVGAMCRSDDINAIWISTPNTLHAEHVVTAARHGKHVICEKPMAVTLVECDRMLRAVEDNGVKFLQGHSKIYGAPIRAMEEIVRSGRLGRVVQIQTFNFNDWLQRPRLAPELDTAKGGGLVYRQGPHLVDIVRFLGGGLVKNVRAVTGRADRNFDTEGHFSALLEFESGAAGTLAMNGYGYFDVTELTWSIGESGYPQVGKRVFPRKPRLTGPADPHKKSTVASERQEFSGERKQPFFGLTVVACERGVIRQSPDGIYVYTEDGREEIPCHGGRGREAELDELSSAIAEKRDCFPDGRWGKATLEVCLAMMASSRDGRSRAMHHQVAAPGVAKSRFKSTTRSSISRKAGGGRR